MPHRRVKGKSQEIDAFLLRELLTRRRALVAS
jgi:hypothetical protein